MLAACAYNLQRVNELMDLGGLVFTDAQASEATKCLRTHLKCFWWLAACYYQRRQMLFKIRCKSHYLWHCADDIEKTKMNPSVYLCCAEEAFLGVVKRIMVRCHGATATQQFFMRYLLALAVSLAEFKKAECQME